MNVSRKLKIDAYPKRESMISFSASWTKRSRTARRLTATSLCNKEGDGAVEYFFCMLSHKFFRNPISYSSFSFWAPSAAVRTMYPKLSSRIDSMISFNRCLSDSSSIRRDIPICSDVGIRTRSRPGRDIWVVSRAPFDPKGALAAWAIIS